MNRVKKVFSLLLVVILFVLSIPEMAEATDFEMPKNRVVSVDGSKETTIMTFDYYYEHNVYVSLKGVRAALSGTGKAFSMQVVNGEIQITTGVSEESYALTWSEEELTNAVRVDVARHKLFVDGSEKKYYGIKKTLSDGSIDYFYSLIDVAMMLDVDFDLQNDRIYFDTTKPFTVTVEEFENSGYLQGVNSILIGDCTTGDVFFSYDSDKAFCIASTTKLMTYLLVMEAIDAGEITMNDMVPLSAKAEELSRGVDGVITMTAGNTAPVSELLIGTLVASSNESALALSEYVGGSEQGFAERMNQRAKELGLTSAVFYNAHGLPLYEEHKIPGKVQNHMSSKDMFALVSYIMGKYPQITDITTLKECYLNNLYANVRNTNAILYNMEEVKGLKTGTTNKAGACLVTLLETTYEGQTHYLAVVLLGAETNIDRETISEIGARLALSLVGTSTGETVTVEEELVPSDPEMVVSRLVIEAKKRSQNKN